MEAHYRGAGQASNAAVRQQPNATGLSTMAVTTPFPKISNSGQKRRRTSLGPNRFGARWLLRIKALFGLPSRRRLARAALQIDRIRHYESHFGRLSDAELKKTGLRLRGGARGGESLDR